VDELGGMLKLFFLSGVANQAGLMRSRKRFHLLTSSPLDI
jgi:hypothetical protein